jgi:GAF domain-containing protein
MQPFAVDQTGLPEPMQKVIANHLLVERPSRTPDYKAEVEATAAIVKAMVDSPQTVLTRLSEAVLQLTGSDSAGVSLAGRDDGEQVFLWQAAVGLFEKYIGSVVPHDESPCGSVLNIDTTLLMLNPGEAYKTAAGVEPPIREVLLVPFHVEGRIAGTVWVISQGSKVFDAEDARLVTHISELAALAYQIQTKLGDMELMSRTVQLVADGQFTQPATAAVRNAAGNSQSH